MKTGTTVLTIILSVCYCIGLSMWHGWFVVGKYWLNAPTWQVVGFGSAPLWILVLIVLLIRAMAKLESESE